jgi:hypothetical protein
MLLLSRIPGRALVVPNAAFTNVRLANGSFLNP